MSRFNYVRAELWTVYSTTQGISCKASWMLTYVTSYVPIIRLLVQFIDMGFTHEQARLALLSTGSLEEATDYILNHPQPPPARVGVM